MPRHQEDNRFRIPRLIWGQFVTRCNELGKHPQQVLLDLVVAWIYEKHVPGSPVTPQPMAPKEPIDDDKFIQDLLNTDELFNWD